VVYHATPSTDYTLNIDIVDPEEHTYGASADDVWVQQYKSAINGAFNTLTGKTTDFNVSGSVSWTRKKIDGGTAESIADYLGMSGTMSIAVGGFSVSTPSIPIASGITVKGKTGMNGITFSLTGTGAYEGSSSTLSLTGSASTSLSVTMEADAAYVLEISVSGSSTVGLSLSGPGSNPIHEIKATGSITANSLVGKFDVKINTGLGWSVDVYHAEHQFGTSVSVPLDYTILSY
jgi:hypothetical protein